MTRPLPDNDIQCFSKPKCTSLSGCRLVSSSFAWFSSSCIFYSFVILADYTLSTNYKHPLDTLHVQNIPQGHCSNNLQSVLLIVMSMYGSAWLWATQNKARWNNIEQDVTCRQPDNTRRLSPGLKNAVRRHFVSLRQNESKVCYEISYIRKWKQWSTIVTCNFHIRSNSIIYIYG